MKRILLTLATLAVLTLPSLSSAAQGRPGGYASLFLGVSLLDDTDVTSYLYNTGETIPERIEFDPGVYVGGTAGYDFGIIRLEGELSYRYNEMDSITNRDFGVKYAGVDGDVGIFAMMANAFVDFHNDSPITPYLGGGIGVATVYLSDTDGDGLLIYAEDDDSVFAYQVGGGLDIALNRQTSLDIGYRYFSTETVRFDSDWYQSVKFDTESHNIAVGFRFKF